MVTVNDKQDVAFTVIFENGVEHEEVQSFNIVQAAGINQSEGAVVDGDIVGRAGKRSFSGMSEPYTAVVVVRACWIGSDGKTEGRNLAHALQFSCIDDGGAIRIIIEIILEFTAKIMKYKEDNNVIRMEKFTNDLVEKACKNNTQKRIHLRF